METNLHTEYDNTPAAAPRSPPLMRRLIGSAAMRAALAAYAMVMSLANPASFRRDNHANVKLLTGLILLVITFVVGFIFLGILADSGAELQTNANLTDTDHTLIGLIPTLVIIALMAAAITFLVVGFREAGVGGGK